MTRIMNATLALFVWAVLSCNAQAGETNPDPHAQHRKMLNEQDKATANFAEISLPDVVLLSQDGVEVKLQSEVVGDRIVVMNFVYTTCTTVCPVLSAIFSQIQKQLGDRLGPEVVLVSLTVDPARDTPARLKAYSEKMHAGENWVWLTGRQQTVKAVLEELGAYTPNFTEHPSMVLVGDGSSGQWSRFLGFPASDQIIKKVDEFSAARMAHLSHTAMKEQ